MDEVQAASSGRFAPVSAGGVVLNRQPYRAGVRLKIAVARLKFCAHLDKPDADADQQRLVESDPSALTCQRFADGVSALRVGFDCMSMMFNLRLCHQIQMMHDSPLVQNCVTTEPDWVKLAKSKDTPGEAGRFDPLVCRCAADRCRLLPRQEVGQSAQRINYAIGI